jgi:hypothetical protein
MQSGKSRLSETTPVSKTRRGRKRIVRIFAHFLDSRSDMNELLFSVLAQTGQKTATIDTKFLGSIKALWCELISTSGPIVPIVAGAALAVFAVLFVLDEGKGYISTALRILLGIAILVFIPSLLSAGFGIDMGCNPAAKVVAP